MVTEKKKNKANSALVHPSIISDFPTVKLSGRRVSASLVCFQTTMYIRLEIHIIFVGGFMEFVHNKKITKYH